MLIPLRVVAKRSGEEKPLQITSRTEDTVQKSPSNFPWERRPQHDQYDPVDPDLWADLWLASWIHMTSPPMTCMLSSFLPFHSTQSLLLFTRSYRYHTLLIEEDLRQAVVPCRYGYWAGDDIALCCSGGSRAIPSHSRVKIASRHSTASGPSR